MSALPPFFIGERPAVEIDGGLVSVRLTTGQEAVSTRALWRRFLETEIRRLNDYEWEERDRRCVVDLEQSKPAKPKRQKG